MNNEKAIALALWKLISSYVENEIKSNSEFVHKIVAIIGDEAVKPKQKKLKPQLVAKIDPFVLLEQGIDKLTETLATLDIKELKSVIATNGMDNSKLAMKWKKRDKLEKLIIEATQRRSSHGKAFWGAS
ncbi:hypothetical protein RsTz2092_13370 [Deferribacterales bacterium RsTz2092]